jgi:hypothetical protein
MVRERKNYYPERMEWSKEYGGACKRGMNDIFDDYSGWVKKEWENCSRRRQQQ